jgi:hypothetical protein
MCLERGYHLGQERDRAGLSSLRGVADVGRSGARLRDCAAFQAQVFQTGFLSRKSSRLLHALATGAWLDHKTDERSDAGRSSQTGTFKAVARDGTHEYDTCARVARNVLPGGEPDG